MSANRDTHTSSQRETGWSNALNRISVTELTSQLERSELKEEAQMNTAREETGESEGQALSKPKGGWAEGRTAVHVGDGADVPARQVGIEGGGSGEHCAGEEWVRAKRQALGKPKGGWVEGRTELHVGDAAHIPPREVPVEVRALPEHCR